MINSILLKVLGTVFLVSGIALRYKIAQRKFNRRAMTGLERFPSYGKAVATRILERIFRIIATLMILIGVGLLLLSSRLVGAHFP